MLLLGVTVLKAQDTIVLRNGDELKVKVKEVSDTELKYQLWDNQDGPMYTKKVADVFMVKYKGGHREVYSSTQQAVPAATAQSQLGGLYHQYGNFMEHSNGDLILNGRKLSDAQIKEILGVSGFETYSSANSQRRHGKVNLALGWTEFGLGAFFAVLAYTSKSNATQSDFLIISNILFLASQIQIPLGYILKGVGKGRLNWIAENYNNGQSAYSNNLSIGFTPTLVCAPDAAGNRSYGLGAGVSLHF